MSNFVKRNFKAFSFVIYIKVHSYEKIICEKGTLFLSQIICVGLSAHGLNGLLY